jgi:hypothetical protein
MEEVDGDEVGLASPTTIQKTRVPRIQQLSEVLKERDREKC